MRTHILIITTLIFNLSLFSQTEKRLISGKVYKFTGLITDSITQDTLRLVTVEVLNKNLERIKATRSDFDGIYYFYICSNELQNDSLLIKTTYPFYKQTVFRFKVNSDSIINIRMSSDKNKTISEEKFKEYNSKVIHYQCVADYQFNEKEYQLNRTYRHFCSGEEKKYQNLITDNENLYEWILAEN